MVVSYCPGGGELPDWSERARPRVTKPAFPNSYLGGFISICGLDAAGESRGGVEPKRRVEGRFRKLLLAPGKESLYYVRITRTGRHIYERQILLSGLRRGGRERPVRDILVYGLAFVQKENIYNRYQ